MRIPSQVVCIASLSLLAAVAASTTAGAQTIERPAAGIALKNGETTEVGNVFFIGANCRALTTSTPEVEMMDGPPGVTVSIKPAMVTPRGLGCAKPVSGGKMYISAKDIEDYSNTRMVVRVTYKTREGERQRSQNFNITLFP